MQNLILNFGTKIQRSLNFEFPYFFANLASKIAKIPYAESNVEFWREF